MCDLPSNQSMATSASPLGQSGAASMPELVETPTDRSVHCVASCSTNAAILCVASECVQGDTADSPIDATVREMQVLTIADEQE